MRKFNETIQRTAQKNPGFSKFLRGYYCFLTVIYFVIGFGIAFSSAPFLVATAFSVLACSLGVFCYNVASTFNYFIKHEELNELHSNQR